MNLLNLSKAKIGVVGDLICDKYIFGTVERISPEAPVPVVKVSDEKYFLGGASNVARNLKSIGCNTHLFGLVGNDICGEKLLNIVKQHGLNTENIIISEDRPTTSKTRVIAHSQQIVRFDKEEILKIEETITDKIVDKIEKLKLDAVIISDYGKGVITKHLIDKLTKIKGLFISIDPKITNADIYKNIDIITPNLKEAKEMSAIEINSFRNGIEMAAEKIIKSSNTKYLLITLGEKGMVLFDKNGKLYNQKSKAKDVYDVTGAGDTVIAVLTAAFVSGFNIESAMKIANAAAGVVVGKMGTATASIQEIKDNL